MDELASQRTSRLLVKSTTTHTRHAVNPIMLIHRQICHVCERREHL